MLYTKEILDLCDDAAIKVSSTRGGGSDTFALTVIIDYTVGLEGYLGLFQIKVKFYDDTHPFLGFGGLRKCVISPPLPFYLYKVRYLILSMFLRGIGCVYKYKTQGKYLVYVKEFLQPNHPTPP